MPRHRLTVLALTTLLTGMTAACGGSSTSHGSAPAAKNSAIYPAPTTLAEVCGVLDYQSFGSLIGTPDHSGPDYSKLAATSEEHGASCYASFNPPAGLSGSGVSILQIRTDLTFWQDAATAEQEVQAAQSMAAKDPASAVSPVPGVGSEAYRFVQHDFGHGVMELVVDAGSGNLEIAEQVDTDGSSALTAQQIDTFYQKMAASVAQDLAAVQHASSTWGSSAGAGSPPPSS